MSGAWREAWEAHRLLTVGQLTKRTGLDMAVGAAVGILLLLIWQATHRPEVDYRLEAGCKLPTAEGEMTVAVILDGQFKCWRYR